MKTKVASKLGEVANILILPYGRHNWTIDGITFYMAHEGGQTGRYQLTAVDAESGEWLGSQSYDWNVWLGHCYGQVELIPKFQAKYLKQEVA